jgi:transcriptional regulator with PAS, ATPase and Fis domain
LSLALTNGILETTLALVDEGIITLNKEGYINHINQEGATILGVLTSEIANKHFSFFMTREQSRLIEDLLAGGNPVYDFETIIANKSTEHRLLMNIRPVLDREENNPKGAVIRFLQTEKVDKLVAHRGGCRATYTFEDILGKSAVMVKAIQVCRHVGGKMINVLLIGESGTGKELFAQAIHNQFRPDGPFVAINCASMPRNLIESELFGYEGGAFTGAERKGRPGKIELANNGTLFLDEIGDMPLEIQPVLLRILEDKKVMRLGGNRYIPVNFRVIAATNKNLYQMVSEKSFREDLYYRLSVFSIRIPPLRDRGDDILLLARDFIEDICRKLNYKVPNLSPEVEKRLTEYNWPGNVRQLLNAMVYAVNMVQGNLIKINDMPDELLYDNSVHISTRKILPLDELEKAAILETMKLTNNNTLEAARLLDIGRTTIYRKLKKYGINC